MDEVLISQVEVGADEDAERRARFPVGARITFEDLEAAGREPVIDELRDREPVSWVPALGGWLVSGWEPARQVLHPRTPTTVEAEQNLVRASLGRMMLTVDGSEHTRMRTALDAPFRAREIEERFGDSLRGLVEELVVGLRGQSGAEIGQDFAAPYAVRMAGQALGLSLDDVARIDGFYADFAGAMVYDGDPEPVRRADRARADLNALLLDELDRCRRRPDGSITSALAQDGRGLSDDEIVAQLRVVMFGAIETIQASVMNTLLLLLQHPSQLDDVRREPGLLDGAVAEAIRLVPPVAFVERWTREPVRVADVDIPAREFVGVSVIGANRDPAVFADPGVFDVRRPNAGRALSFSYGIHACLGLHLARIQSTAAIGGLLAAFPGLELGRFEPPSGFAFRRPASLEIGW